MNRQQLIETAQWIRDNCIVIDTETTGLGENDTIIELAAVNPKDRAVVINVLVRPLSPMSAGAEKTHGISMADAQYSGTAAPRTISHLVEARQRWGRTLSLASFNWKFDARMILQTAFRSVRTDTIAEAHDLTAPTTGQTQCIMELANRYLHEHLEWDAEQSKFRRLSLEKCLEITGIQREGQAHRALSDALAAADLLNYIADGKQP